MDIFEKALEWYQSGDYGKMEAALELYSKKELEKEIDKFKKKEVVYSEMGFANEHKFQMEWQALKYKSDAYIDINGEILMMLHKLYNEEEDGNN